MTRVTCDIRRVFDFHDTIAINLLRLLAGCNDLRNALSFMEKSRSIGLITDDTYEHWDPIYFLRLVYGHLVETLKAFKELADSKKACELISKSNSDAREAFKKLGEVLKDKSIRKQMHLFRNKAIFHYDCDHFSESLDWWNSKRSKAEDVRTIAQLENDALKIKFPIADDVIAIILLQICDLNIKEFRSSITKAKEITILLHEFALQLLKQLVQKKSGV